jgi:hypothetical protein
VKSRALRGVPTVTMQRISVNLRRFPRTCFPDSLPFALIRGQSVFPITSDHARCRAILAIVSPPRSFVSFVVKAFAFPIWILWRCPAILAIVSPPCSFVSFVVKAFAFQFGFFGNFGDLGNPPFVVLKSRSEARDPYRLECPFRLPILLCAL